MYRLLVILFVMATLLMATTPASIPLYLGGVPGGKHDAGPERDTTTAQDGLVMGRSVMRIGNVTEPSLAFYPAAANNSGAAVIIFPGGGYRILAYDLEGTEVCEWLNSLGVNAVLVKYRVPERADVPRYQEPLQDARLALSYVRAHAAEWKLDAKQIGVLGFSAGGHLSALLSNSTPSPDFAILIYPAYLAEGDKLNTLAPEVVVTASTPPTFLVQTEDDPVHVESSLVYYRALQAKKIPAEMHIFSTGGHGYGLRPDPQKPVTQWPALAAAWMKARGIIH